MPLVPDRLDLDHQDAVAHVHIRIDDLAVMRESIADLLQVHTVDRDHDRDLGHIPEVAAAVGRVIEVTIARGNSDHTTTAARITSHASKVSTIRIIVVVATISRIEIASTTINTIIVSVTVAVVLTIAVVEAVVVIVVVDSFIINKASVIFATDGTSGTVVLRRVIDIAIAATHLIQ